MNLMEIGKEFCKDVFTLENLPTGFKKSLNTFMINREKGLSERDFFLEEVVKAQEEWIVAKRNFEHVSEQDLVDQAVFTMAAAEKKYMYLLKEARKNSLTSYYVYTIFGENTMGKL